jgi:hypothetical protein
MAATHPVSPPAAHRHHVDAAAVLGVFLLLHALAHGVGTQSNIARISDDESAALLGGVWHLTNDVALGVAAIAWALAGLAMAAAGILALRHARSARRFAVVVTAVSLALCVLFLWAAVIGAVIDVLLLVVLWRVPGLLRADRGSAPARP